jgi:hypothetical protein
MKVLGGMFVLRGIAASHVAAYHAHAQVDPGVAHLDAIFADVGLSGGEFDLIQVLAFLGHFSLPRIVLCAAIAAAFVD